MADILDKITAYKLDEIAAAKAAHPLAEIEARAQAADAPRGCSVGVRSARPADEPVAGGGAPRRARAQV